MINLSTAAFLIQLSNLQCAGHRRPAVPLGFRSRMLRRSHLGRWPLPPSISNLRSPTITLSAGLAPVSFSAAAINCPLVGPPAIQIAAHNPFLGKIMGDVKILQNLLGIDCGLGGGDGHFLARLC